jgi:hypothetical protein
MRCRAVILAVVVATVAATITGISVAGATTRRDPPLNGNQLNAATLSASEAGSGLTAQPTPADTPEYCNESSNYLNVLALGGQDIQRAKFTGDQVVVTELLARALISNGTGIFERTKQAVASCDVPDDWSAGYSAAFGDRILLGGGILPSPTLPMSLPGKPPQMMALEFVGRVGGTGPVILANDELFIVWGPYQLVVTRLTTAPDIGSVVPIATEALTKLQIVTGQQPAPTTSTTRPKHKGKKKHKK